ncbi:MAG: DUF2442 domain-containing protein [Taibaiella sp.]|nr:DUF2442 domain-containing protein [Taibaiella sp.]
MNPRVNAVQPKPDYILAVKFNNGEQKLFDVKPYLTKGIFTALADRSIFNQVKVFNGSVLWPGELDLCPDTLYEDSVAINKA